MVMTADSTFVDTNVLVYATQQDSPWHSDALAALDRSKRASQQLVISPQIIREYLVVITRGGGPLAPLRLALAVRNIELIRGQFLVLDENSAVVSALLSLVQRFPVGGKQIHDANIVATMQAYGVPRLLTNNVDDFSRFDDLVSVVSLASVPPS
jgi:predicted nucleic acid-binding protein